MGERVVLIYRNCLLEIGDRLPKPVFAAFVLEEDPSHVQFIGLYAARIPLS
jgi:hypothetical protein